MISPYFTEEHQMLRETLRRFVEKEIVPYGETWEEEGVVPRELLKKMGNLGLLGLTFEEEYGGGGMDTLATVVLAEELARSSFGGVTVTVLVHTDMASPHLANAGTPEQKKKYLPSLISGDLVSAVCITEPAAGSDVAGIRTSARKEGEEWVLNGSKIFITNGVHGDIFFVAAKTNPEAAGAHGISMFILEKGMAGFTVGRSLKKHGWCSSDTAELFFDNVRVPHGNLLGTENHGFYSVMKNFQNERIALATMAVGEAQKAMEITIEYVKNREAFGKTLYDNAAVRQKLAVMQTKVSMTRNFVYQVAWLDSQGVDCIKEVSMAKAFAGEMVNEVMYACVQLHGGMGYMKESVIERMSRDARVQSIGGGATEVMYEEVAKRL
ncbi:MAG: acyl-CoA dehydrogenase family protein [SAR324 cluster bacterium]|nr:acyl-CoA dehydrogenase family protein [SAR324 cluster bacterium]